MKRKFRTFSILDEEEAKEKPDFKKLQPGTKEWMFHWKKFPEDQNKMIEFSKAKPKEKTVLIKRKK